MKILLVRTGLLLIWICIAVAGAVLYGIINNQITATISPEYFSVFKRGQFWLVLDQLGMMYTSTRIQSAVIGILATWWYGLFLGIMLSISSMVGRYKPLSTLRYIHAVVWVMIITLTVSILFGLGAYLIEPLIKPDSYNWPFLTGIQDIRKTFAIGWWHNGAYLGALIAAIWASFWVQKQRRTM